MQSIKRGGIGLNRSWAASLKVGWRATFVRRALWRSPAAEVLKLNFDSSFVQSIRRGGIGGFIKGWNGNVVGNLSRPVESLDGNEAEFLLF